MIVMSIYRNSHYLRYVRKTVNVFPKHHYIILVINITSAIINTNYSMIFHRIEDSRLFLGRFMV